jgi:hypothetical protein
MVQLDNLQLFGFKPVLRGCIVFDISFWYIDKGMCKFFIYLSKGKGTYIYIYIYFFVPLR